MKLTGGVVDSGNMAPPDRGRPRTTCTNIDKQIMKVVFKFRGQAKVTASFIKQILPATRKLSHRTLQRRLVEAGLKYLRRRRKTLVPTIHKPARLKWCRWVLKRTASHFAKWIYTDGTVFYIARSVTEKESSKRGSLGPMVWRQANGCDAMYEDCIGPSSYWKGQGAVIRVWGLLIGGALCIYIMPAGEVMNRWWYQWLIINKFPVWIAKHLGQRAKTFLVQDHERALWCDEPITAMPEQRITLLANYPKCSQDLNPIETAWREVRARLYDTERTDREGRNAFIIRPKLAVEWVNRNRGDYLNTLCNCQKAWARDVLQAKGSRTTH